MTQASKLSDSDSPFDPSVPFRAILGGQEYQRAVVRRVKDGDTLVAEFDVSFGITYTPKDGLRIEGLFCAEVHGGTPATLASGETARAAAAERLRVGDTVYVRVSKTAKGADRATLGRLIASVWYRNAAGAWTDFAEEMRRLGFDGQGIGIKAA